MRLTQKTLDKLPTVRLYIGLDTFYTIPYMNARKPVAIPLEQKNFRPNGKGLPWACGIANAILGHKTLFNHPVFYVHVIGSTVYIVAIVDKGKLPKFAFRYRHRGGKLVRAYDKSRRNPTYIKKFIALLKEQPKLMLEKGRHESGKGSHSPGSVTGHREKHAPRGDKNKLNLAGARRRAEQAGLIPQGLSF
jgi:hypothetical protein